MLGAKDMLALDARLCYSPAEQRLLRSATIAAKKYKTYPGSTIGSSPRYIRETAPLPDGNFHVLMTISGMWLTQDLFRPELLAALGDYDHAALSSIQDDTWKSHAMTLEAGILLERPGRKARWHERLVGREDQETVSRITTQRSLLDGRYLTIREAETALRSLSLLGKQTTDVTRLYNALDTVAYGALMPGQRRH